MNRASTWWKRKGEVASGGRRKSVYEVKIVAWAIFTANDLKREKKR